MKSFRLFALFMFVASAVFVEAQDQPFGTAFAPTFTFTETYREGVVFSSQEDDFLDHTTSSISARVRVSMQGLSPEEITNESGLYFEVGNLIFDLLIEDGTRSVVDGINVVRWRFEGTDPDTGDPISNACTVTLRYNSTELSVQVASADAPDDFNILAPEKVGGEETVTNEPLTVDLTVGPYFLEQRICYATGTAGFYNTTVNGQLFEDLSTVSLSGEFDLENPVVKISFPQVDANLKVNSIEVNGTVTDNIKPVRVAVSLNGGPYVASEPLVDDGLWRVAAVGPLSPGPNSVVARAEDESGNTDVSAVRLFNYFPHSQLTLTAEGNAPGTVSGDFVSTLNYSPTQPVAPLNVNLELGKLFTLVATAGTDAIFDRWTSNRPLSPVQAASPRLEFIMSENLSLTAHFVINPFVAVDGRYVGLLTSPNSGTNGLINGKVTAQGAFSFKAKFGNATIPIKGRFSADGRFQREVVADGIEYAVDLTLNFTDGGVRTITGTISRGTSSLSFTAELSPFNKTLRPVPAGLVGTFNFLLPRRADTTDVNYPAGIGFGRLTISPAGAAKFTGKLADGTPFSGGTLLSGAQRWPFFNSLYEGGGMVSGWINLDPGQVDQDLNGVVDWKRPNTSRQKGFAGQSDLTGARSLGSNALAALAASSPNQLTLQSAENDPFPLSLTVPFPLRPVGRTTVNVPPGNSVRSITCKVRPKTGLITGKLVEGSATSKIQGILVGSKVNEAGGYVLRNGFSSAVSIAPAPPAK